MSGSDTSPVLATRRSRPGRSVTSMRPSGRKARPQGWASPFATVSNLIFPASVSMTPSSAAQPDTAVTASAAMMARLRSDLMPNMTPLTWAL